MIGTPVTEKLVAAFKQAAFGRKSEKSDPDQFELALEDLETAIAAVHAEEAADVPVARGAPKPRAANRGALPKHLPRIEEVIEPFLLQQGLIARTPRGRMLASKGWSHLGLDAPKSPDQASLF